MSKRKLYKIIRELEFYTKQGIAGVGEIAEFDNEVKEYRLTIDPAYLELFDEIAQNLRAVSKNVGRKSRSLMTAKYDADHTVKDCMKRIKNTMV